MIDPIVPPVVTAVLKAALPRAVAAYQASQAAVARDLLVKRIARGRPWAVHEDAAAAALWRYMRAATEGTARLNLELLADALVNGVAEPTFAPDEFKQQADRLESLTREEIFVVAAMLRVRNVPAADGEAAHVTRYNAAIQEALGMGVFQDQGDVTACMASLTRTGWVAPSGGFGFTGHSPTRALDAVARLVDFEAHAKCGQGNDQSPV